MYVFGSIGWSIGMLCACNYMYMHNCRVMYVGLFVCVYSGLLGCLYVCVCCVLACMYVCMNVGSYACRIICMYVFGSIGLSDRVVYFACLSVCVHA